MHAKGKFDIAMTPQTDEVPAGRFALDKTYHGDIEGNGVGQMISKRLENGTAIYFAIEEVTGSVGGKSGGFTLAHKGFMNSDSQVLEIEIMEGSGTDELAGISGTMGIEQKDGEHYYELTFEL